MNAFTKKDLEEMWRRTPERKVNVTLAKLIELCLRTRYKVAVSFSGGKDSTVLLDLVSSFWAAERKNHGDSPLVVIFANTGNEFACMPSFVRSYCERCEKRYGIKIDLHISRPKKGFKDVLISDGYPIGSKKIARQVRTIQKWLSQSNLDYTADVEPLLDNGLQSAIDLRRITPETTEFSATAILYLTGFKKNDEKAENWKLSKRWRPLIFAPFRVSEKCCECLKKAPLRLIQRDHGLSPILGEMASDGDTRLNAYLKTGCNLFEGEKAVSKPMGFWLEQDVLNYIHRQDLPVSPVYGDLVRMNDGRLCFTGQKRTGCKLCLFGIQFEPRRFVELAEIEPAAVRYALKPTADGGLGYLEVINYINKHCGCKVEIPAV